MIKDVNITIYAKHIVLEVPDVDYKKTVNSFSVLMNDLDKRMISLGDYSDEEKFMHGIRNILAEADDREIEKLFKDNEEEIKFQKNIRDLCITDVSNDTYLYWNEYKSRFRLLYAFDTDNFEPDIAAKFLWNYCRVLYRECKFKFLNKFNYKIRFDNYELIYDSKKEEFESLLSKIIIKKKSLMINGVKI